MFTLSPFSQDAHLHAVKDPVLRNGVCVALCDYWLNIVKRYPDLPSVNRMRMLAQRIPEALRHQKAYGQLRGAVGRNEARRQVGAGLGLNYEEQTTIMRAFVGMAGIRARLATDLDRTGAAATWSLRFAGGGGHAIAGFRGLIRVTGNMHRASVHIFDPNIGEYAGELTDLDAILADLFGKFALYRTVNEVHRTSEG
jgi:hypothetical protein